MQQVHSCVNGSSSSELAAAEEMTPDEVTDRLSRLEITQEDGESTCGASSETEDVVGEAYHRMNEMNDRINNSNSSCADVLADVQQDKDAIITNDNEGDGNDEEAEKGKISAISECMSTLTLESSAANDHVSDDQYQHVNGITSESFIDVTADGAEDMQETNCVSVMLPETSSVTHCVLSLIHI